MAVQIPFAARPRRALMCLEPVGEDFARDLIEKRKGKAEVQEAVDKIFPSLPAFFGKSGSANNAMYRKWGLKKRTNEEMRDDYIRRAKELVEKLGLKLPAVKEAA